MSFDVIGSFGTAGANAGEFSAFWGFGITVSGGIIYISGGQTRNKIYKFSAATPYGFIGESTTNTFSPAVFSNGSIQGGFLFVRDNWTALNKLNITDWVNVRNTGALVGWCCSDTTKTYIGSSSTAVVRSYLNSDLTQSQTLTLGVTGNQVALDDNFLYAVRAVVSATALVSVISKSSFTVVDSWTVSNDAGGSSGSICLYNDHLLLLGGANGIRIYNTRAKTLFTTIANPTAIVGADVPLSIFADASGIYVTYASANKVVVFTNDIPPMSGALTLNRKTSPYTWGQTNYN